MEIYMKNSLVGDFGGRLEKVCLALGMTHQEMASALGVNPAYLAEVINGKKSNPGIAFAAEIAAHFKVNLNYLLMGEGEMFLR
jgi:transcriptional regulator with XRE-family HTH domain